MTNTLAYYESPKFTDNKVLLHWPRAQCYETLYGRNLKF